MSVSIRIPWIDTMKVIGMYFIVVGHMFPEGYKSIYAFSVPLFFVVSGMLSKQEGLTGLFWQKTYKSLVVPMAILCLVSLLFALIKNHTLSLLYPGELCKWLIQNLLGFQSGGG